jgi:hypothetical protein
MNKRNGLMSVLGIALLMTAAGCHEQKLGGAETAAAAAPAQKPVSLFSEGYQQGILQSPTLDWPRGSISDVVLTSSLPIEAIDAPVGAWVDQGRSVLTFQVRGVGRAMTVTGDDVDRDRFALQSAQLAAQQAIELARQKVTSVAAELEEAEHGEGLYGVAQSRKQYDVARAALARSQREANSQVAPAQSRLQRDEAQVNVGTQYANVSEVPAPITGEVVWLKAKVEQSAGTPGAVVGEIANSDQVRIHATFDDPSRSIVLPQTQVQVEFAGDPDWIVPGTIVQTQQGADTNAATIKLIDQGHLIRPTSRIVSIGLKASSQAPQPAPQPTQGQTP